MACGRRACGSPQRKYMLEMQHFTCARTYKMLFFQHECDRSQGPDFGRSRLGVFWLYLEEESGATGHSKDPDIVAGTSLAGSAAASASAFTGVGEARPGDDPRCPAYSGKGGGGVQSVQQQADRRERLRKRHAGSGSHLSSGGEKILPSAVRRSAFNSVPSGARSASIPAGNSRSRSPDLHACDSRRRSCRRGGDRRARV